MRGRGDMLVEGGMARVMASLFFCFLLSLVGEGKR